MKKRDFRTPESYKAERDTRDMLGNFLRARGFRDVSDDRRPIGKSESQTIHASTPDGERLAMRVRLCWYHKSQGSYSYSAAQLRARVKKNDWEGTLWALVEQARSKDITHFLFVQRDGERIAHAALIPLSEIVPIWCAQRDISNSLIAQDKLGRRKTNYAMNGSSPTLWLQVDKAPEVAAVLWGHKGVRDLASMEIVNPMSDRINDLLQKDRYNPTPVAVDISEAPQRFQTEIYRVLRDTKLAREVKWSHGFECQVCHHPPLKLSEFKFYAEVHHIKPLGSPHDGPDVSENILCVCPNCHVLLDYGATSLDIEKLGTSPIHTVGSDYVDYHNKRIFGKVKIMC